MSDVNIRIRDNGPLVFDGGGFPVSPDKPTVALCRCGSSKNKPFCDGSHRDAGFEAVDRAPKS